MVDWLTVMQTAFNDKDFSLVYEFFTRDTLIKMQYTWLKDKNWKEIYEADIISFKRKSKVSALVQFKDDWFKVSVNVSQCTTRTTWLKYLTSEYQCEVIWNIYENPELLATA